MAKSKKEKTSKKDKKTEINLETEQFEENETSAEEVEIEPEISVSDEEFIALQEEYAQLNDKYLRTVAEYDNFRKRTAKEKTAIYTSSLTDVCKAWLPVLDNLDRAVEAAKIADAEQQGMLEGIEMVQKQAVETMKQLGVEEIDCQGKEFNPEYHEAIAHIDDEKYEENTIIEVIQKGYIKDEHVIRHSMVVVAN